jgi:hypothetical protein
MSDSFLVSPATRGRAAVTRLLRSPWAFALVVVIAYGLLAVGYLGRHHFDITSFIQAGDLFVDAKQLLSPIAIKPNSTGYDGEFYYRLALDPFQLQQSAFGVTFDNPPWRIQRIVYPVLAWIAAFGQPARVPAALFLVNMLGLATVAAFAVKFTARLRLPVQTPLAIMLWPGFILALAHDTTEIVAAAFLIAALYAYVGKRLVAYAILGALATLTRETSILALGGIFCLELFRAIRGGRSQWRSLIICGLALLPYLVWREALHIVWGGSMQQAAIAHNVDWPFLGPLGLLRDALASIRRFIRTSPVDAAIGCFVFGSAAWLLIFYAITAARVPAALRGKESAVFAAGCLPIMALMSVLNAGGPWVNPTAFFRAFTECYVIGSLVQAAQPPPRWLMWIMFAGCAVALLGVWRIGIAEP